MPAAAGSAYDAGMAGPLDPGTLQTAATATQKLAGYARELVGLEAPHRRFWVKFAGAVQAERLDLPWEIISTWRVDPSFHQVIDAVLIGAQRADGRLRVRLATTVRSLPDNSRHEPEEALERLMLLARRAASEAVEDPRHPAALAVQHTNLIREDFDAVREGVRNHMRLVTAADEDAQRAHATMTARLDSIEQRLDAQEQTGRQTIELLTQVLAVLRVADEAEVRPPSPPVVAASYGESSSGDGRPMRVPRTWERAAARLALRVAAFPDVAEVLLVDIAAIGLRVGDRTAYADLVVTRSDGGRWLAEAKRQPGGASAREARRQLAQEALDAAGGRWKWATLTPPAVERAQTWAELTG